MLIFGAEHVRAKRQPQEIGCEYGGGGEPVFRLERLGKLAGARPLAGRATQPSARGEQTVRKPVRLIRSSVVPAACCPEGRRGVSGWHRGDVTACSQFEPGQRRQPRQNFQMPVPVWGKLADG